METVRSKSNELQFASNEVIIVTLPATEWGDNSSALRSQLETTRYVIQCIVTVIVVIIGVVGNVFNIAVLTRRWMKSSTNHYLTALAVYDSLYLVFSLTLSVYHCSPIGSLSWYTYYRMPIGRPLTDLCSNTGVWLTLTFTVERYIGVCFPMKGKVWCTTRRARYVIVVVCLAAFVVTSPEFFDREVVTTVNRLNHSELSVQPTRLGNQTSYRIGYYYANHILFTFLPLALLLFFNSLLIRAVMYAARQRKSMTKASDLMTSATAMTSKTLRHQRDQQRITVMLISVVVVFLVCQLPQAIQKLYIEYLESSGTFDSEKQVLMRITANYFNLLVMINCSVNFVLYSSFSTKFRMTFRRLFCHPRTPDVVLTTDMTGIQTQMDDFSSTGNRANDVSANLRGSSSSIASFSVTNPQQCRSRSPQQCRSRSPQQRRSRSPQQYESGSPSRSPARSPVLSGGHRGYDRLNRNRLSPSNIEMKTFV